MPNSNTATLLVACPDKPGLVLALSQFIFENGGNIIDSDQYTDRDAGLFFMRLCWDLTHFKIPSDQIYKALLPLKEHNAISAHLFFSKHKPQVAVFASKSMHCLYDLLMEEKQGSLAGNIGLVVSNHKEAREVAQHFAVPFEYLPVSENNKASVEQTQKKLLAEHGIELIVLARYMQVLSPLFAEEWKNRIINIHHGFLPAFQGAKPYHQAHDRGVKIIGATAHYVTSELDQGPIIVQAVGPVTHRDSVPELIRKGRDLERRVLTGAVRLHLQHRIMVADARTIVFE